MAAPLSGAEYVLVAQVPKAGGRWHQAHFNRRVTEQFFRLEEGEERSVTLEKIDSDGRLLGMTTRPLVFSQVNRNSKIEFDFSPVRDYPEEGVPILLVLELDVRRFRHFLLLPGQPGYDEMLRLNESLPAVGSGHRRVITNLDEVELRWPACPLRGTIGASG